MNLIDLQDWQSTLVMVIRTVQLAWRPEEKYPLLPILESSTCQISNLSLTRTPKMILNFTAKHPREEKDCSSSRIYAPMEMAIGVFKPFEKRRCADAVQSCLNLAGDSLTFEMCSFWKILMGKQWNKLI